MQVDILESNPEVSFVYSSFKTVDDIGNEIHRPFFNDCIKKSRSGYIVDSLLKGNYILTLTTCFRKSMLMSNKYLSGYNGNQFDYYFFIKAAMQGPVVFIPDELGVYRKSPNGIVNSAREEILSWFINVYKHAVIDFIKFKEIKTNYTLLSRIKVILHAFYRSVKWSLTSKDKQFMHMLLKSLILSKDV